MTFTFRRKRSFDSNEELLDAVQALIAEMMSAGHSSPAAALTDGLRCLNGLTDGWALLLESLDKVRTGMSDGLTRAQRTTLDDARAAVDAVVHRR